MAGWALFAWPELSGETVSGWVASPDAWLQPGAVAHAISDNTRRVDSGDID